jgi:hypothetical protein
MSARNRYKRARRVVRELYEQPLHAKVGPTSWDLEKGDWWSIDPIGSDRGKDRYVGFDYGFPEIQEAYDVIVDSEGLLVSLAAAIKGHVK